MKKDTRMLRLPSRRDVLKLIGGASGGGLVLLTLKPVASYAQSTETDVSILFAALYLEHEAVAAYQLGIDGGLLAGDALNRASAFQDDHKYHRDGITATIRTLGSEPIPAKRKYHFKRLKSDTDFVRLARNLEQDFVRAYSTLAANIQNKDVLNYAAHVLADEVRHLTVWSHVLEARNY